MNARQLRHNYASLLIEAGESVTVVAARLGRKNATETVHTYNHRWPSIEEQTRLALSRAFQMRTSRGPGNRCTPRDLRLRLQRPERTGASTSGTDECSTKSKSAVRPAKRACPAITHGRCALILSLTVGGLASIVDGL